MHDEHGHGDLLQVLCEVGLGESDDAVVVRLGAAHHALSPPVPDETLGGLRAGSVEPVEWPGWEIVIELGAVGGELCLQTVEHLFR